MKAAIIGSRNIHITDLGEYLPENTMEVVSGGEKGIDSDAKRYAQENNVLMKEFLSDYKRFGRVVPLKHNLEIIAYADVVIAFWDGQSHGTKFVIDNCKKQGVPVKAIIV